MRLLTMRKLTGGAMLLILACSLNLWGCGSRVVYLSSATTKMVQLRESVPGVKVWVKDSTGTAIPGVATLMEGGYYRSDLQREERK